MLGHVQELSGSEVSGSGVKTTEFCVKVDFVPLWNVSVPPGDDGTNVLETNCK